MACEIDFPNTHIMDVNEIEDSIIDLQTDYLVKSGLLRYINEHLIRGFVTKDTVTLAFDFKDYYSEECDYFDDEDDDTYEKISDFIVNMCDGTGITTTHSTVKNRKVEFTFKK